MLLSGAQDINIFSFSKKMYCMFEMCLHSSITKTMIKLIFCCSLETKKAQKLVFILCVNKTTVVSIKITQKNKETVKLN